MSAPNVNFNYQERLRRAKQYNNKKAEKNEVVVNTSDPNYEKYDITAKQIFSNAPKKCYQLSVKWKKTQKPVITLKWST